MTATNRIGGRLSSAGVMKALEGKTIEFRYPVANYYGVKLRYETRRVRVQESGVRRFGDNPKDYEAARKDPLLRRCGLIVRGFDLDKQAWRTFYSGSMKGLRVLEDGAVSNTANGGRVFIVHRPHDWNPTAPSDVPPNVERIEKENPELASTFVRTFNRCEMSDRTGRWAIM